jgi:5-methylthioadenosine/S-adenosylhomocysteine deaminase
MTSLLIHNAAILTMDSDDTIRQTGWVALDGAHIEDSGGGAPPELLLTRAARVIDGSGKALLPGLVNAHTHLSQTYLRGLGDDKTLLDWLQTVVWPIEAQMTPEDMYLASLLGLAENIRCGVTAVGQHHKIVSSPAHVEAAAHAAERAGLRMQLARGWVDLGDAAQPPDQILQQTQALYEQWHGQADGRITIAFGPMAAWRCSDETMQRTVAQARRWGINTHIHVAEVDEENRRMEERSGMRSVQWLDELGVLGPDMQLVHCVYLNDDDIERLAHRDAVVVHCPTSNMYLGSGIARVPEMLAQGITVALATDGSASHNSQDMVETIKTATLLARVGRKEAHALRPLQTLRMATAAGARFLGREEDLGQIAPGFRADLTLVNLNTLRAMPVHRPESALVFNSSGLDVDTVIVDGQILLDGGRLTMLDEAELLDQCRHAAQNLLQRAGVTA